MNRSAFSRLLCFIWPVLAAGLVYECNFDGTKLKQGLEQNLSSPSAPLAFIRELPPFRTVSHSCIVTTNGKESFLHVKAKTYGETRGKSSCIPSQTCTCRILDLYADQTE